MVILTIPTFSIALGASTTVYSINYSIFYSFSINTAATPSPVGVLVSSIGGGTGQLTAVLLIEQAPVGRPRDATGCSNFINNIVDSSNNNPNIPSTSPNDYSNRSPSSWPSREVDLGDHQARQGPWRSVGKGVWCKTTHPNMAVS